jgi:hypothetical protein
LREASFNSEKIVSGPRVSVRSLYKKMIIVACPTDKGDPGRLTIVANMCSIMPLAGIRPGDGGTLTIVVNKCSIVRNAPCRMNMHLSRRPDPCPFFFPDLSSITAARSSFHVVVHMSHYADSSGGACARSRVQGYRSNRNHSIALDPVGELSGFPLVPCPDCGMAQVLEGRTQKEGENHGRLYFKCARNSVGCLLCLPNLS